MFEGGEATSSDAVLEAWHAFKKGLDGAGDALRSFAFHAILRGVVPRLSDAAPRLCLSPDAVHRIAKDLVAQGILTIADDGDTVTGAAGLSRVRTEHTLHMHGHRFYTWCALDAVGIPAALEADAVVEGPLAGTDELVRVHIAQGVADVLSHADLRVAVPAPDAETVVVEALCPEIRFHTAERAPPHPEIAVLTIDEAMELGRVLWGDFA